jgi:argininosuccinate lyase
VALAEKTGKPLDRLSLADFQGVDKHFGPEVRGVFNLKKAMSRRKLTGAPGTSEVKKQLARWSRQLG